jgi:hypothetical protein
MFCYGIRVLSLSLVPSLARSSGLSSPHSLHWLLWRLCGQTLRGFFCAAPPTASAWPAPLPDAADSAGVALSSPFPSASASLSLSVPSPNMLVVRLALEMLGTHEARVAWEAPLGFVSCLSGAGAAS